MVIVHCIESFQVIKEQGHLKEELTKALRVADSFKQAPAPTASSEGVVGHHQLARNRSGTDVNDDTSSSFDFIPASLGGGCSVANTGPSRSGQKQLFLEKLDRIFASISQF